MANGNINSNDLQNTCENNSLTTEIHKYRHDEKGNLYLLKEGKDLLVSEQYIEVIALTRTEEHSEWTKRISFKDMDGNERFINIPCKILIEARETQKMLVDAGFPMRCCNKSVIEYLKDIEPKERATQIRRAGWISDTEYICPSFQIMNSDNKESFFLAGDTNNYGFSQKGSLEQWQERICKKCEANYILTFALCVGLSGVLLRFFPTLGTKIINFVGKSSIGKTTALRVAASMWGGLDFIRQWRATDNAHEGVAEYYNDALMVLDELGQIDIKDVSQVIYMFGNERGKSRLTRGATLKKVKEWRLSILSSGEIGIADKIEEGGKKVKGGILVRCIDIDVQISEELGIFNTLHDFESGAEFSNYLKNQVTEYHGVTAEEFIKGLCGKNSEDIRKHYEDFQQRIFNKFELQNADCQVKRIAETFALFLTAGVLASLDQLKVFTHNTEGIELAIFAVFERFLEERGGKKSYEEQEIIQHVLNFLMQYESRFRKIEENRDRMINDCLGYMNVCSEKKTYYINPKPFREEICRGMNHKMVKKTLLRGELLRCDGNNKDPKCPSYIDSNRPRMVTLVVKISDDKNKEDI
ncbi:MAG: DUF927 domain-containing protein [Endomicrobium sp.]|jgi:putative DNA primase/helicase|nr:DUF927 domain-containing protein [Endomicrobium sp.]